ncbi:carbohydrate ABC transporter permease [Citreimonas salinaria]|uniref:Maltose ABC transporter membrane protein /trehalose ABC transporter membrane protein /sucrose ABC transporter membrane protein n=1 Tax=Citreimonas salinaria TaxID=321339 RepID=A0A1H3II44_9RHOB|nr:carbohydrate ABC transporter permease [Citreimonas salinaria]SDY27476.1 maltose ABC transporter membrane protein /trehalose ABC transporter membrane protein /sucrose ABC transporter membrane protein [Citreimonas salinaria]
MDNIAGKRTGLSLVTHLATLVLVIVWIVPTLGLLITSLRDQDAISQTGWWRALQGAPQPYVLSIPVDDQVQRDGLWVLETNVFAGPTGEALPDDILDRSRVDAFGTSRLRGPTTEPGETVETRDGVTVTVEANGDLRAAAPERMTGQLVLPMALVAPPQLTLDNYAEVLTDMNTAERQQARSMGQQLDDMLFSDEALFGPFVNTMTVAIPATVIPIVIAAFAAYALAWMDFPGRGLLIAVVVGLLVVPLQLAFVPLTIIHGWLGIGKSFLGIWLAHTGFGLPLAVYLLRNYMVGLPRDIIENAKVDGATDFQIFTKIVLPLSFPALASFAIFQFLWTWNDLLVASVFLPADTDSTVMTRFVVTNLLGSRGGEWHILAAAAFVMIAVPLLVFFAMQKYLVRGMLAGSVK